MTRLDFSGKEFVYNHHLSVQYSELKPDLAKSMVGKDGQAKLDGNLIIHGDNLRALKALLPRYEGRVNCIYIDPPYNTGNEGWCYNDNVNMPYLQEWFSNNPVNQEDMQRHEKWCCMMWPRLTLLRQLLADDGVIFISIDDNEVHHLRMMMDEIFGEDNFVASIIWHSNKNVMKGSHYIRKDHEYIMAYRKSDSLKKIRTENKNLSFSNPDNDPKGEWLSTNATYTDGGFKYSIKLPDGTSCVRNWRFSQDDYESGNVNLFFNNGNIPRLKGYKSEYNIHNKTASSLILDIATTTTSRNNLAAIFSCDVKDIPFDTPKDNNLIRYLLEIGSNKNSIILDSFAGSGTTAHATLELNKEDGGERKFILIECEDYANDVTAERVRCVIKGVPSAKAEALKSGLGGDFTFCELSEPIDFDKLLDGENLPSSKEFAGLVWNLFSDKAFDEKKYNEKEFLIGSKDNELVFCFYKPDKNYLLSNESCLNTIRAEELSSSYPNKEIIVYAPACFVPNSILAKNNIKFAYLPFALFKLG